MTEATYKKKKQLIWKLTYSFKGLGLHHLDKEHGSRHSAGEIAESSQLQVDRNRDRNGQSGPGVSF